MHIRKCTKGKKKKKSQKQSGAELCQAQAKLGQNAEATTKQNIHYKHNDDIKENYTFKKLKFL